MHTRSLKKTCATKYRTKTLKTKYWRPGTEYSEILLKFVRIHSIEKDFVVISEKAISIASGRMIDEAKISAGLSAKFLASFWIRKIWGFFLGPLARINRVNIERLRNFPLKEGAAHKQVVLSYAGPFYALKNFSEGGIDASNLPYELVSLPLKDPSLVARKISSFIVDKTGKRLTVMLLDSDKTFSLKSLHFTSRPTSVRGIYNIGPLAYLLGRFLKMRARSTPVAISCEYLDAEDALKISAIANRAMKSGAGQTVWDMSRRFNVNITKVSWKMLESLIHRPIVIVRKISE